MQVSVCPPSTREYAAPSFSHFHLTTVEVVTTSEWIDTRYVMMNLMLTYTATRCLVASDTVWQEFRPNEDVDINTMNDGGFNVGYVTAGEYLRYTVDVTKKSKRPIHEGLWIRAVVQFETFSCGVVPVSVHSCAPYDTCHYRIAKVRDFSVTAITSY